MSKVTNVWHNNSEIKAHWQATTLGDVLLTIKNGLNCKQDKRGIGDRVSRIESISSGVFDLGKVGFTTVSDRDKAKFKLQFGDILFSHINSPIHVGKTAVFDLDEDVYHGVNLLVMRPVSALIPEYLRHYLNFLYVQGYWRGICKQSVNQASVNQQDIGRVPITFPTHKEEQERIVFTLEEAFAGIDKTLSNCQANVEKAQALFDSRLSSLLNKRGALWERASLDDLLERGWIIDHMDGNHGGDYPRKEEFISEGVPYISANSISDNQVNMSKAKYLSPQRAAKLRKGFAKDGDVLFAHNATVGPVATLSTSEPVVVLGTSLTYYRCNPASVRPTYLAHYMRSYSFRIQYETIMRQSTRNQVPITKQREFFHVIPPVFEQDAIANELDQLAADATRLQRIYEQKIAALNDLKQSISIEAFSGNL